MTSLTKALRRDFLTSSDLLHIVDELGLDKKVAASLVMEASSKSYDNSTSGLAATNIQAAIFEYLNTPQTGEGSFFERSMSGTYTVGQSGGEDFATIQSAVNFFRNLLTSTDASPKTFASDGEEPYVELVVLETTENQVDVDGVDLSFMLVKPAPGYSSASITTKLSVEDGGQSPLWPFGSTQITASRGGSINLWVPDGLTKQVFGSCILSRGGTLKVVKPKFDSTSSKELFRFNTLTLLELSEFNAGDLGSNHIIEALDCELRELSKLSAEGLKGGMTLSGSSKAFIGRTLSELTLNCESGSVVTTEDPGQVGKHSIEGLSLSTGSEAHLKGVTYTSGSPWSITVGAKLFIDNGSAPGSIPSVNIDAGHLHTKGALANNSSSDTVTLNRASRFHSDNLYNGNVNVPLNTFSPLGVYTKT